MKRNLKALGLVLAAAFAMSAVAASAASAEHIHHFLAKEAGPTDVTHLTAEATTDQVLELTGGSGDAFTCNNVNVNGTITGREVTKVTVEPLYTNCTAIKGGEEFSATIRTNECHYEFTGETNASNQGEMTIQCPAGEQIEIRVTAFQLPCIDIESGQEVTGVNYYEGESGGAKDTHLEANLHGIKSISTPGTANCSGGPEAVTHTTGTYTGEMTIRGFKDSGHTEPAATVVTTS